MYSKVGDIVIVGIFKRHGIGITEGGDECLVDLAWIT